MLVGYLQEVVRHPVKSFRGESVSETNVMSYGLYGDRSHAWIDEGRGDKFLTITQFKEMACYQASFVGEEEIEEYPKLEIVTPEGRKWAWEDSELTQELEQKSGRKVRLVVYPPNEVPLGAIEEEHLLLVTDASLDELQEQWGKEGLDHRRFRPNLFISLTDKVPFIEESWFGKRVKIGAEVEIEIKRHCERCMIITVDPENAERDPSLLKTVAKERDNHFGVYASVIKTGKIRVGDEIHLISPVKKGSD